MSSEQQAIITRLQEYRGTVVEEKPALCFACNHPYHQITCDCDRTIEDGGIEVSGPCGCKGEE